MTRSFMNFLAAALVAGLAVALPILVIGQASPPPFNAPERSTKMSCAYCHNTHSGTFVTVGTNAIEALCMSCHNGTFTDPVTGRTAVAVATHTDASSSYGTYKVSCLGCHSAHRNVKADGSDVVNPPSGYGNWMLIGDLVSEASSADRLARIRRPVIVDTLGNNNSGNRNIFTDDVMDGFYCSNVADVETAANSGAVRSGNVVTIKTAASHRFPVGTSVRIGSVANASFNGGPFVIASVPTAKTFTFSQTGANATSGGGVARSGAVNLAGCNVDPPSASDQTRKVIFWDNRYPPATGASQWAQPLWTAPTAAGSQWYNGTCNVCHTRTSHHRRDNSTNNSQNAAVDHTHNVTKACHDCHVHSKGWLK